MIVTKVTPTVAPKTVTYDVDPEEGEFTFMVSVAKAGHPSLAAGAILCWVHGDHPCVHSKAVREHLA